MTEDRLPLAELLQKAGDGDFLRAVAEAVLQLLMESRRGGPDRRRAVRALGGAAELAQRLSGSARSTPGSARSSCACRSCARAPTSRPSSSPGR